jgi:hypothetical protein
MHQGQDDLAISTPPASPLRQAAGGRISTEISPRFSTPRAQLGGVRGSATPGNAARPMLGMLSKLSASWDGGRLSTSSPLSRGGSSASGNLSVEGNVVFADVGQTNFSPMHGMLTTPRQTIQRPVDGSGSLCDSRSESVVSASTPSFSFVGNPSTVGDGASAAATANLPPPLPPPPGFAYSIAKDENGQVQGQVQGHAAEETSPALPSNQPKPVSFGVMTRELSMVDEQAERRFANPAPIPNPKQRLGTSLC